MNVDGIDIRSRSDLAKLVEKLANDFKANPELWENKTVDDYLEALGRWIEDMDGYYANIGVEMPSSPTWSVVADMLLAAKFYE